MEIGADAIQIFNQSPRMWRPTKYTDADFERFREAMDASPLQSVVIHAIYLINPASDDPELREKSLNALVHALRVGDAIGADGVVLHPGSLVGKDRAVALDLANELIGEALAETDSCRLLLENNAGSQAKLGLTPEELGSMLEHADGNPRLGVCLDSCHLFSSGYDIRTAEGTKTVVDEVESYCGKDRLRCIHLNDSKTPLGSRQDRHENIGEGEIGDEGLAAFLSEPRFAGLPVLLETPGPDKKGPDSNEISRARALAP